LKSASLVPVSLDQPLRDALFAGGFDANMALFELEFPQ
jgi:hypothetical protein